LEAQAGFSVLVPSYLPGNCEFKDGSYSPQPIGEVTLEYNTRDHHACFDITERTTQVGVVHQPYVGPGSVEEIAIDGQPAIYVRGMWWVDMQRVAGNGQVDQPAHLSRQQIQALLNQAVWIEGPKQLSFEQDSLLIRIKADTSVSKDDLIKIAESAK
jgi:hypothetical protein